MYSYFYIILGKVTYYLVAVGGVVILLLFCIVVLLLLNYKRNNRKERKQGDRNSTDVTMSNENGHLENEQNIYNEIDETLSVSGRNSYISVNDISSVKSSTEMANTCDDYLIPCHSDTPKFNIRISVNESIHDIFTNPNNEKEDETNSNDEDAYEEDKKSTGSKSVEYLNPYEPLTESKDVHAYERNSIQI